MVALKMAVNGILIVVRPCGVEVSASDERHHWSKVVKAASYLLVSDEQGYLDLKRRGDKSMRSKGR